MKKVILLGVLLLVILQLTPATAQETKYGGGVFFNRSVPVLDFHDRYSSSQLYGLVFDYQVSSRATLEFEYQHMTMDEGKVEDIAFRWPIDKQKYLSPDAQSRFNLNSFLVSALAHLKSKQSGENLQLLPYVAIGAGFYDYQDRITGLIFPGQKTATLDQNLVLDSTQDEHTALGANLGLGMTIIQGRYGLDIRGRYHMILGDLRPLEAWGLTNVFPITMLDLRTAFKVYW